MTEQQGTLNGSRRRRRTRLPLLASIAAIIVVGATAGWIAAKYFTGRLAETEAINVSLPQAEKAVTPGAGLPRTPRTVGSQKTPPATRGSRATAEAKPPRTSVAPAEQSRPGPVAAKENAPVEAIRVVDSMPPAAGYALADWVRGDTPSGFLDTATVNGRSIKEDGGRQIRESDVIDLSGWAGDAGVGVRYPYVLVSSCGWVVASAPVTLARPDVAKSVHPNLRRSGWRVRVAARHLPDCKNAALRVWGVAPGDRKLVLPLNGRVPVPDVILKSRRAVRFEAARAPLRPSDMKPLLPVRISVRTGTLNIRRCAGVECAVQGKLKKGEWTVLALDEAKDWLLVALPDRAGWVAKRYVDLRPGKK